MIGSDYPFVIMERDPIARLTELGLPAQDNEMLVRRNALRWLGRDEA
jgi:aminocarboxymuconate-semialdehyde decarboxylase